ncbi:hypothetical protein [Marivirga arenosa]|uniref:Uncharacterized protein n=1 Tax=Marivirga arenosa TaxID=3059076 RepID=A0AA51ZSG3_9BACT|nr:hypothetical protein [Marivirga sp. BKB1-2]WNB17095.1 hypothetical protein QYS47_32940 [Marivirga sp. BKB1-2]
MKKLLLLLVGLVILFSIACREEYEFYHKKEDLNVAVKIDSDTLLKSMVNSLITSENQRTSNFEFNTEFGTLDVENIIRRISEQNPKYPNYTIKLIPPIDSIQTVEYLLLTPREDQYYGSILQFQSDKKEFTESYFQDYTGVIRTLNLERNILAEERFIQGESSTHSAVNERSTSIDACNCYYVLSPVLGPITGDVIMYDLVMQCDCTSGGGSGTPIGGPPISGGTNDPNYGLSELDQKELLEMTIENLNDPDERRSAQLLYIFKHNGQKGRDFFQNITDLINTPGISVGEVYDINFIVEDYY